MTPLSDRRRRRQLSPQELRNAILNQIEYYFSDDNLAGDVYLKQHMDENGWVPITFIASFPRFDRLTKDIGLILFTLISCSPTVEVEGMKVRRRTSWNKWILDAIMRMQWADDTDTGLSLPDPSPSPSPSSES